ncbi:hypothetical protein [Nostoc sp. MG11]|uniref:hypothetical protein n=1 Tax=Nostoc sp. MG11 TaxID=2721166 RepID=UPI0018668F05|nr:hypothetical protein [Nostoc sp. MG11]
MKIDKSKIVVGTITIVITSVAIAAPGSALSLNQFLSDIVTSLQSENQNGNTIAQQAINDAWENIKKDALASMQEEQGDMGSSDPVGSSQRLRTRLRESRSQSEANRYAQKLEVELTRSAISALTGKQGQSETKEKIETTEQAAQSARDFADQAQYVDSSQEILRIMAGQNAQIVSMLAQQRTDTLPARQDTAHSNLMLSQIAENSLGEQEKERIKDIGLTSLSIELTGISVLDPSIKKSPE